ncbi:helix-turn-helix transcriptional regulator [Catenulispora yoronensis]|uniref:helix-turn-helix transcriptional regulator n=1 Tax=Catenulispora yoronensis TaxID=450799 RepID=UPI0031D73AE1
MSDTVLDSSARFAAPGVQVRSGIRPDVRPEVRSDGRSEARPDGRSGTRSEARPDGRSEARHEERRRLLAALTAVRGGSARIVEIAGEPGSGKTRLLNELASAAARAGVRMLSGRCSEPDRDTLVHMLTRAMAAEAVIGAGVPAVPIVPVAPATLDPAPNLDRECPPHPVDDEHLDAFRAAVGRFAREPLVLILDDFHWADEASVEFIDHLLRWPPAAPLLLVVSHRPAQSGARLRSTLAHCAELGTVERIELRPLTRAESALVLELPEDDEVLGGLHEAARGNPHWLVVLAGLDRSGAGPEPAPARPDDDVFHQFTARTLGETALLGPVERTVLNTAVVLGGDSDIDFLAAAAGLDYDAVCDGAGDLVRRDLLRPAGPARFALRHPLLGRALQPGIPSCFPELVHRRAAQFLADRDAPAAEQAAHLELSGDLTGPEELGILIRAAADVVRTAPDQAVHWCRVALRWLAQGGVHQGCRAEVLLLLARTLGGSGQLEESRELLHEILRLEPEPGRIRAAAASLCAIIEYLIGHRPEARAVLAAELECADRYAPQDAARLRIEHGLLTMSGEVGLDPELMRAVTAAASEAGVDRATASGALALRALDDVLHRRYAAADESIPACAVRIDGIADAALADKLLYLVALAWAEMYTARFRDAERHFRRAVAIAASSGNIVVIPMFLNGLLYVDLHVGPLDTVEIKDWHSLEAGGGHGDDVRTVALALESMSTLWTDDGDSARALRLAEESFSLYPSRLCGKTSSTLALASATVLDGDVSRCVSLVLTSGGGPTLENLPPALRPMCFELLTYAAAAAGHPTADDWAARAQESAGTMPMPHQQAYALTAQAHVARHRGEHAAAAALYLRAADLFGSVQMVRVRARTLILAASCLADAGDLGQADAAYGLAEELGRDCGAARLSSDARRLRGRLAENRPPGRDHGDTRRALSALTNREREIAVAVSTGRRTREIAEDLHLSPRTVDVHLTRIYRKLDLSSRAALTKLITEMELLLPASLGPVVGRGPGAGPGERSGNGSRAGTKRLAPARPARYENGTLGAVG